MPNHDAVMILLEMLKNCPVCRGKGEVKKWEAVNPKTKIPTGLFKGMKPCPYCDKARKAIEKNVSA